MAGTTGRRRPEGKRWRIGWRRVVNWSLAVIAAVVVAAALDALWYVRAVNPVVSGALQIKGLGAPVDIVRDVEGVPHIFAGNDDDAAFAQGYVHAQDRLWQMEFQRRAENGRLAEVLGPQALDADILFRTLGIRRTAEAMWAHFTAKDRAPLEAYARGVNAYLAGHRGPLPPEFWLTNTPAPEPWSPIDSIGWTLMMAWDLSGTWRFQLFRLQLAEQGVDIADIAQFLPSVPGDHRPSSDAIKAVLAPLLAIKHADGGPLPNLPPLLNGAATGLGSNEWAVSGARSVTGKPLLANDPHLALDAPSVWYLVHLATADGSNVIGASLPGVPGVVLGHNGSIAWGFTNTGPDAQDLYFEKLDPDDPDRYLTPDGYRPFDTVDERIAIKGAPDRVLHVRSTRHGPVLSDAIGSFKRAAPSGYVLALAWTALSPTNRTPLAGAKLQKAKTWPAFVDAMRDFDAPQQNIVYADVDGHIGFLAPGKVPIRNPANVLGGLYPAPGWDATYDWSGFIPYDALPRTLDPPSGSVVTANNRIVGDDYPYTITHTWEPSFRHDRIVALLGATAKHSLAGFEAMQADVLSPPMHETLPYLLAAPITDPVAQAAQKQLAAWDGTMDARRIEPTIAAAWTSELSLLIATTRLGADLARRTHDQRPQFVLDVLQDRDGAARWCGAAATASTNANPCNGLIAEALQHALADLERRYGRDQSKWVWGTVHKARSAHQPFAHVPYLARLFDLRVADGGDGSTIDVAQYFPGNAAEPYTATHGPSLRALYDLADLENSRFIQSTGQSGIVTSDFYSNFLARWAAVKTIPMITNRTTIEKNALGTLRLAP